MPLLVALADTLMVLAALTAERVRRDVEVVARAGLEIDVFLEESLASVARAVPYAAACLATVDPSTKLLTGARKYGDLLGRNDHDHEFGLMEYGEDEPTAFMRLAETGVDAASVSVAAASSAEVSPRLERFMNPYFGYTDELRTLCPRRQPSVGRDSDVPRGRRRRFQ